MSDVDSTPSPGLLTALLAVQGEAPTLTKDAVNPHFKSRYTPLDTIVETIGPILHSHGLIWTTLPTRDEHGNPALHYRLCHAPTGEVLQDTMPLLLSKADAQGLGSAITYARRYALCAVLNLVADDDDDGAGVGAGAGGVPASASSGRTATEKQLNYVRSLLRKQKVTLGETRRMLQTAGLKLAEGDDTHAGVARLTAEQASSVIEFLKSGHMPTGESDIPAGADDFTHPPAPPQDIIEPAQEALS